MKVLCIDYGTRYIGLAVSNDKATIAFPLNHIRLKTKNAWHKILSELIKTEEVELLLIGLPTNMHGQETQISKQVRQFAAELSELTTIPHQFWPEFGTSKQAEERIKSENSHSEAARIMLEEYLDNLNYP